MDNRAGQILDVKILAIIVAIVIAILAIFFGIVVTRGIEPINGTASEISIQGQKSAKNFKLEKGVAAVGTMNGGLFYTVGNDKMLPIASIAKVITILVVLDAKSFDDETFIEMTAADVERWRKTVSENGSNLQVVKGQRLSMRQILDGIMLSSANNLSDGLAIWAFGSLADYRLAAEKWLAENSLENTKIGADASGLDPGTVSTAADLIKIGRLAMQNPILKQIVGQQTANFPRLGKIENMNRLIGVGGFTGIKTGTTEEAGDGLLFANEYNSETIIGVVLHQDGNEKRFSETKRFMNFVKNQLETLTLPAGSIAGYYSLPWGRVARVTVADEIKIMAWAGSEIKPEININPISEAFSKGDTVGEIVFGGKKSGLILVEDIEMPDAFWKLTNIDKLVF